MLHDQAGISCRRGDDREASRHRLENDIREALVIRRKNQQGRPSEQGWNSIAFAHESEMLRRQAQRVRFFLQCCFGSAISPGDNAGQCRLATPCQRERLQKPIKTLARMQAADGGRDYTARRQRDL